MKFNIQIDTDDLMGDYSCCDDGYKFEELIVARATEGLINLIVNSDEWQSKTVIDEIANALLETKAENIENSFNKQITKKIEETSVDKKIADLVKKIKINNIEKEILEKINIGKIIRSEVRNIMEEKLR